MDRRVVRIALTRELGRNDGLRDWLPDDAEVVEIPLTQTRFDEVDVASARLAALAGHRWLTIVVTSARSARYVVSALAVAPDAEVFSVGPATTRALTDLGVTVGVQSLGGAAELASLVHDGPALLLGAEAMRPELGEALRTRGLLVDVVDVYRTEPVALSEAQCGQLADCDVVLVGAPSAWAVARGVVSQSSWVVVPGATTAQAVATDHARVITGWDAGLARRLAEVSGDEKSDTEQ